MEPKADEDEGAILAAVLLAEEKFAGAFEITGSEQFKHRVIEIMLKHNIKARLKSPEQEALRRELAEKHTPSSDTHQPQDPQTTNQENKTPVIPLISQQEIKPIFGRVPAADLTPISARDWWRGQKQAIHMWAKNEDELLTDLECLGPEPSADQVFWFDSSGNWHDIPINAMESLENDLLAGFKAGTNNELRERDAVSSNEPGAEDDTNDKESMMAATQVENNQEPHPVLRGVKKLDDGTFETTALLFKGKGNYLQGFIKIGEQKHQVIAHLNERKPDPKTGEVGPNYIKLSEPYGNGDDTKWKEIGYGNAMNHRKDGKPVYFDEVLFSVGDNIIKAKITKHVDDELHSKLGFKEAKRERPSKNSEYANTSTSQQEEKSLIKSGVLVAHGEDYFNFDQDENLSYFVKYRDNEGEQIVWGIDLERAISESGAQIGNNIELENEGYEEVTVDALVRDNNGVPVGHEPIETHRNKWKVNIRKLSESIKNDNSSKMATSKEETTTAQKKSRAQARVKA